MSNRQSQLVSNCNNSDNINSNIKFNTLNNRNEPSIVESVKEPYGGYQVYSCTGVRHRRISNDCKQYIGIITSIEVIFFCQKILSW